MSLATVLIVVVWAGVTLYAVLGGADFGAGILQLMARGTAAAAERQAIARSMGPVWEANHVWLIFVVTAFFSAFPRAFSALGTVAFLPATLAVVAIVVRGCAFAFAGQIEGRPDVTATTQLMFSAASVAAPFLFGTVAGGLALQRAHVGELGFWIGPFQLVVGSLAVALCGALAAIFLAVEMTRAGEAELAASFGRRGVWATTAAGVLALVALAVASGAAPRLFHDLTGRALPEVLAAIVAGSAAVRALWQRRYRSARASIGISAAAIVWGWGIAQYPRLVGPKLTIDNAAASRPALTAIAIALGAGLLILAPSLWLLYVAFRRHPVEVTT
ncbi:MAG TPA: cytochrome d ubiquinol oxidase subunit II [Solirubrobacteraceae bacterium]